MNKRVVGIHLSIIILAFFLRIYHLTQIPNSLSADEAAFAYNAYSVLKTGRDEFGHFLPLYFQSFDDYKNPLFVYILVPVIALFGLNDWVIRLPSVVCGVGVVIFFYLLTRQLTHSSKTALLASLFAAVSPWLIQYSRIAVEMELALFVSLVAVWVFLKSYANPKLLILTVFLCALSFYSYHANKVWIIGFSTVLLIIHKRMSRAIFISILLFILLVLPYFKLLKTDNIGLRPFAISVFSRQEENQVQSQLLLSDFQRKDWFGSFIHNRRLTPINQSINGYLKILSPELLFAISIYNQIPITRLFFMWQLPLIVLGIFSITRWSRQLVIIFSWIFIGLVPGALTIFPPYDRRILIVSYPLIYLCRLGLLVLLKHVTQTLLIKRLMLLGTIVIIGLSTAIYIHHYFIHGLQTIVELWGNGMKELVFTTQTEKAKYRKVVVSLKLNQTLTFFLYYEKYPPDKYLRSGGTISGGYLDERNTFDAYQFKFIKPQDLESNTLYVWSVSETQPCLKVLKTTYLTDGHALANLGVYNREGNGCNI